MKRCQRSSRFGHVHRYCQMVSFSKSRFFLAFNRDVATADVILEIKDLFRALFSSICGAVKFRRL